MFVLGRLFYVQVIWGEELQEKAIDQWTREIPIIANRGKIVDSNGVVLATNQDTYTVFVRKKAVQDMNLTVNQLSKVLELSKEYVLERLTKTTSSEVTLKKQVSKEQISNLAKVELSGVYYSRDNTRYYPYGDMLSNVLGFTSNDGKGQSGLEIYYDKFLSGINGEILYETDIVGKEIENGKASYIPATSGLNVKLTIDYEIQQLADEATRNAMILNGAKSCQILVVEPNTGAIKALSIRPTIDLNNIDRSNTEQLFSLSRNGLFSDIYEPGSTFKILTVAANLEEYYQGNPNAYSESYIFNSSRYRYIDGQKVKCWSTHENGKHSCLDIQGALNNSCNPIFVDMAMRLGKETMYEYIEKFNYGKVTGIDFKGEAQGMIVPINAVMNVDLARIAFGQTIAVTGLQLAMATASAVNGGKYYTPYLVSEIYDDNGIVAEKFEPTLKSNPIGEKASRTLALMLEKVVSEGSGKNAYIEGYRVAGKTGTAQKYENGVIAQGKYVSSFIGFFPANNPKYLALVIVDEPEGQYYGSTVAAPYAKNLFEGIIKLKNIQPEA